ncbi:MFS transporter [Paenibacillus thalictri]|uniref:MFS transporter n=1 Tax=Paenibacillus thalictri TaxID=2527873 RepID=UPI0013EF162F|nr:MFS transporter [Paenibacillus thalictri]
MIRWFVLAVLFVSLIVNFVDKSILGLAAEPIMKDLGISFTQLGLIGSGFYWSFPIAAILIGAFTDKLGSHRAISYMLLAWSIIQIAGGFFVSGFTTLFLYRSLLGISEGGFGPAAFKEMFVWFPQNMRGKAATIFNSGAWIGAFALTPLIVMFIQMAGWKHTFIYSGLIGLVVFFVWTVFVPKQNSNLESDRQAGTPETKFKWSEFYPILLSRTCILTLLASFGYFFLLTWMSVWMPLYLVKIAGLSATQMGWASASIGGVMVITGLVFGVISDRIYKKTHNLRTARVLIVGSGMSVGALIITTLYLAHSPVWAVIAFGVGTGLASVIASMSHIVMSHQLPERTAVFSGIIVAVQNMAGIISPAITGYIIDIAGKGNVEQGFGNSLITVGSVLLFTSLLYLFVNPDKSLKSKEKIEPAMSNV